MEHNIISYSGGKDSTALLLLAIERQPDNMQAVFCDTGNEHEITYDYVRYVEQATGVQIRWVKADFTTQIANKREYVLTHWAEKGVSQADIDRAAEVLVPTGNPFLDMVIWKGRFPSSQAAFCSEELKRNPVLTQVLNPITDSGDDVISWVGVRADESPRRAMLAENELKNTYPNGAERWDFRPILKWTAEDAFAMHKKHGIKHNPLYEQGMGRVGCMPCINVRKAELLEISKRFPEAIERIAEWEIIAGKAAKRGATSFLLPKGETEGKTNMSVFNESNIWKQVEWAKTSRGGRQFDLMSDEASPMCTSIYGLCE